MNGIVFFNLDSIYIINKPLHLESFLDPKVHLRCHKHFLFSLFYFATNLLSLNSKFLFSKLLCSLSTISDVIIMAPAKTNLIFVLRARSTWFLANQNKNNTDFTYKCFLLLFFFLYDIFLVGYCVTIK